MPARLLTLFIKSLVNILSMSVADLDVTLVGFVIFGKNECENRVSTNS